MKKKITTLILLFALVFTGSNVWAATGYAYANYQYNNGEFVAWYYTSVLVDNYLGYMGYTSDYDHGSVDNVHSQIDASRKVVYMTGHSLAGYMGCEPGYLAINDSSGDNATLDTLGYLSNCKLLYFSGCNTGSYSSSQDGYLDTYAYSTLGVDATVAFMGALGDTGSYTTGCNYFDTRVFYHLSQGYNVEDAASQAYSDLIAQGNGGCGTNTRYIYGGATVIY